MISAIATPVVAAIAAAGTPAADEGAIVGALFLIGMALLLWALPAIIAAARGHHNTTAIVLTTLFLGWTGIGWIVALIWAFTNAPNRGS